jgi:hypothetical protein
MVNKQKSSGGSGRPPKHQNKPTALVLGMKIKLEEKPDKPLSKIQRKKSSMNLASLANE